MFLDASRTQQIVGIASPDSDGTFPQMPFVAKPCARYFRFFCQDGSPLAPMNAIPGCA
jgi:hypothetical protein